MKILFLLIVLTQNGAGDINASFVNTETLALCQQKALMLEGVFNTSNIPVIETRCIKSDLQFSEFGHALSSSMIRHFYLVSINDSVVQIKKMLDWRSCMQYERHNTDDSHQYCVSSMQSFEE